MKHHKIKMPDEVKTTLKNMRKEIDDWVSSRQYVQKTNVECVIEDFKHKIGSERRDDIHLLMLPVAHYQFNPIEQLWGAVKGMLMRNNDHDKLDRHEAIYRE